MKQVQAPQIRQLAGIPDTLLLWDIDRTLLTTAGVSREMYSLAFESLTGIASTVVADTAGRTEFEIMNELFRGNAIGADRSWLPTDIEQVLVDSLTQMQIELARRGSALPGAESALRTLAEIPSIFQSVLTGNVRRNAAIKLATFGLDGWLDLSVGAYGSDGKARWELVDLARQRAGGKYRRAFDADSTIIVGDTPKDVEAGLLGGAKTIAVASGTSSVQTLLDAGADYAIESLDSTEAFVRAIVELRRG
ncbi:HAD hydrolase-like protein [Nocardia sp. SYP-A9097]|uniref:HAD family hydrolase n=1 Tax=Nocardia sp. SYP-A9097 TaxID=2663237 RepID=UPI00129BA973|nr:HAD hydrolase-like protein [Nocardia sp. SYP-A9097]